MKIYLINSSYFPLSSLYLYFFLIPITPNITRKNKTPNIIIKLSPISSSPILSLVIVYHSSDVKFIKIWLRYNKRRLELSQSPSYYSRPIKPFLNASSIIFSVKLHSSSEDSFTGLILLYISDFATSYFFQVPPLL